MFTQLTGNRKVKIYLETALRNKSVGHTILFAGPKGASKEEFAKAFATEVLCLNGNSDQHRQKITTGTHPDFHIYRPEGKLGMHSIDAMRELIDEVYLPPYEACRKAFIILEAERMLPYSANALLKTFEEPSLDTLIILVSSAPELMLPTILSRCQVVNFQSKKEADQVKDSFRMAVGMILQILAKGKFGNYSELMASAKEIAEGIQSQNKLSEDTLHAELMKGFSEKATPFQREAIEKEIDGYMALQLQEAANAIFTAILQWHRDLALLSLKGDERFLFHSSFKESLEAALRDRSSPRLPIEQVFKAAEAAKLSLARSTSLQICLETLFLKLNLL